jgi:hypothetical protein
MWLVDDEMVTRWGMSIFIIFISFIWHPWLMRKWCGHPIIISMFKKWLQVIWYEHRQSYPPTNLYTYLFTYPPNYLLTNLPHMHPPTHPPTYYPFTYLPSHAPTYLLHQPPYLPTYFLFPISYNLPTSYLSSNNVTYFVVLQWYEINMWNKKFDQTWTPFDVM